MNLSYLAFKNMVSKPLNLVLSLMLLLLSVSLVTFVLQLSQQLGGQLNKNIAPFDMVVGAKGSPLQLVLSSVLHIDAPTGNIKLKDVDFLYKNPFVQAVIPVSYGDNYKGFRILGTETTYLDYYNTQLETGKLYEKPFEVVAGSNVAKMLDLKVGDKFISSHGLSSSTVQTHDEHPFTIKGILEPTGTVVDQLLITSLESVWSAHDHDEEHHHEDHHNETNHEHHSEKEITSLLVKFKNPLGMVQLPRFINQNTSVQAALPGFEVQRLMKLMGSGVNTVNGIAFAILLVSGFSIFISLLKTIRERRQELALLRIYGLRTKQLLGLTLLEGLFLSLIGFVLGWLLGRLGIWAVSQYMKTLYGYSISIEGPNMLELLLLCITLILAITAILLASRSIFKLNVAKTLSDV